MDLVTLSDRPELADLRHATTAVWPEFMLNDDIATLYYANVESTWPDWCVLAVDGGNVLAVAYAVPFALGPDIERPQLPDDGWDRVIMWSYLDGLARRAPNAVSALEVSILPAARGAGLAESMLTRMIELTADRGIERFVAPVRPSRKHEEPELSMQTYVERTRDDGLPADPWLRVHARMGGRIVKVCPTAMTISGTLAEWRSWTGLPFDRSGPALVPGALAPVHVSVEHDHAVYVEPNVWVEHPVPTRSGA